MLEIASRGNMKISLNWKFGNFHVMNMMEIWIFPDWKLDNIHNRDRGPQERSFGFLRCSSDNNSHICD